MRWHILQRYDRLSRAERRVADTVLRLGERLADATIADLAGQSGVSPSTVVRFCNGVGVRGFKELKRKAVPVEARANPPEDRIGLDEVDSDERLVSFVVGRMQDVVRETRRTLDLPSLGRALGLLRDARYVRVAALGGSAVAGRHAQHYLRRIGIQCAPFSVFEPSDIAVERYEPGDVVLAISYSGSNPLVVDIVADAKRKGAAIVCITSWGENELQAMADVCLQTPFGGPGIIDRHHALERTAQIAILNVLVAGLHLRTGASTRSVE